MLRPLIDRCLYALARLVLRGFYWTVEVTGRERIPRDRPILVVANHYNGMIDAVLLAYVFGRIPRFLAKATLWRRRWVRPFLWLLGLLPVHRPEDRGWEADNRALFAATHQVLARPRGLVAIFPEGMTHDAPSLARIRTGAARLALGAQAAGAQGLTIVPVGLVFSDKFALRSRALAKVGEPIDLDTELEAIVGTGEGAGETNKEAVRRLTNEIEDRLRTVVPGYADLREARALPRAAEIAKRTDQRRSVLVSLAEQEQLSRRLARAPAQHRHAVIDALARYHLGLYLADLRDYQVVSGYTAPQLLKGFFTTAAVVMVLAPFAAVGVVANVVPYWCVVAAGRATRRPMMKGTVRLLTAVAVFPMTWVALVLLLGRPGSVWIAGQLAAMPVTGLLAVACIERLERARRAWRGWQSLRERRALVDDILADRARLVAAVEAAVEAVAGDPEVPAGAIEAVGGGAKDLEDGVSRADAAGAPDPRR